MAAETEVPTTLVLDNAVFMVANRQLRRRILSIDTQCATSNHNSNIDKNMIVSSSTSAYKNDTTSALQNVTTAMTKGAVISSDNFDVREESASSTKKAAFSNTAHVGDDMGPIEATTPEITCDDKEKSPEVAAETYDPNHQNLRNTDMRTDRDPAYG